MLSKIPRGRSGAKNVCVLASGGIDSATLIGQYLRRKYEVWPLYVRCGFVWEKAELFWLRRYLKALKSNHLHPLSVVDSSLSDILSQHWGMSGHKVPARHTGDEKVYIPGRNVFLLSPAALFSSLNNISTIALGVLNGNPFADASALFIQNLEAVLNEAMGSKIKIVLPFRKKSKKQIMQLARGLPLQFSFSCLFPRGMSHCAVCSKCGEREDILEALKIKTSRLSVPRAW